MRIPNAQKARETQTGNSANAAPGTYLMKVQKIREKNGRLLLLWEVTNGASKGAIAWDGYALDNPKACGILMSRLELLGVEIDENGFFDESSAVGKIGEVTLIQNGDFVNVKSVKALDKATLGQLSMPGLEEPEQDDEVPF